MYWTKAHAMTIIPTFIVFVAIAVGLSRVMRNQSENMKLLPLRVIAIILLFLEIVKQVESVKRGYNTYHLPFHFCSLFVFLIPAFAFYSGKQKNIVRTITIVSCFMLFLFMLAVPETIYGDGDIEGFLSDFFSFHTVLFHNLVILAFFYMVALRLFDFNTIKDCKVMAVFYSCYCAIACIMSQIFKENFNSFYECGIEAVDKIRLLLIEKIDWCGQLVYVMALSIVILLFAFGCYWGLRAFAKLTEKFYKKAKDM